MNESELIEYINRNNISSYRLSKLTGISQPTIHRNLAGKFKMKKDTFDKLLEAVEKINNEYTLMNESYVFDEKIDSVLHEPITEFYSGNNQIVKDQAEALKMSSEHIGKLLTQNGKLIDENEKLLEQISQLMERVRELEGK